MREIGISPRFSRDKFVPLQTKQRYSTRDISGEVSLTLFFRGFVPFLSLADFVSRNKNLQVADLQRLKSCFGELVTATTSNAATSTSATSNAGSAVAGILGTVLGGNSNSSSSAGSSIINGILNNVIGSGTFSKQDLCAHTWKYSKPGCAFTSENLLAKAGGEIAANKVEEKLGEYYSKFGFSGSNTYFTFKTDGTFAAKIDGKSWQGNYTFDEKTHAIQMKGLLLSMSGYATKTANGISLLFDQKKLLNLIKTIGSLKGSSTLSALGTIANNYDGMRVGFEMSK